jgi:Haem-binding domain
MKKILGLLVIVLIGIQFIPVERTNPPISLDIGAPDNISNILRTSCYDCHSNETNWPWYSHIAPVSFLVASDVKDARKNLNFSEWDKYSSNKQSQLLEEMIEEIEKEEMPLTSYTFTHPNAKLDPYRINLLKDWVSSRSNKEKSLRYEK